MKQTINISVCPKEYTPYKLHKKSKKKNLNVYRNVNFT